MGKRIVSVATERDIGQRLKSFRLACHMSQMELGAALGVTFQQVQKYENGKNRLSGSRLLIAAEALRVSPSQLLGGNGWGNNEEFAALTDKNVNAMVRSLRVLPPHKRRAVSLAVISMVQAFA